MPRVVCKTSLQLLFAQLVEHALHADDCKKQDTLKSQNNIDPQDNESAFYRIERVGFDVGQRYIQRLIFDIGQENNTKSKHCIFPEAMDIVKFLCKEFWISLFGKSIDNLKTNHRGVFVLQDSVFSWISPFITLDTTAPEVAQMAVLVSLL